MKALTTIGRGSKIYTLWILEDHLVFTERGEAKVKYDRIIEPHLVLAKYRLDEIDSLRRDSEV